MIQNMNSKLVKHSMALMILILLTTLTVSSALTRTVENIKKIF